jgi:hypothetical protein
VVQAVGIGATTKALGPFLSNMETTAPLAAANGQLIAFADAAGRSVPELQSDAVPIRSAAVLVEGLAASGIGPGENQLMPRHPDQSSRPLALAATAARPRGKTSLRGLLSVKHDIISEFVRKKEMGIVNSASRSNGRHSCNAAARPR